MVKWSLKDKADSFFDFDYYVDGREDDHGVFRYFPDGPSWETPQPAPGDLGHMFSNPIGCKFAREGIAEEGALVWW